MPEIFRVQDVTMEDIADALRAASLTTEELYPSEMLTLIGTLSNVGHRYKDERSGEFVEGAEIFNDYANNKAPERYSTARGHKTTTYSAGQFVTGWGSPVSSIPSALLVTNNDAPTNGLKGTTGSVSSKAGIFSVSWDGSVAAGLGAAAFSEDPRNPNKTEFPYRFEIADATHTLFAIRRDGAPVLRNCYGFEDAATYMANNQITAEEGMVYYQLIAPEEEEEA